MGDLVTDPGDAGALLVGVLPLLDVWPGDSGTGGISRLLSSAERRSPPDTSIRALAAAPGFVAPPLSGVSAVLSPSGKKVILRFMSSYVSPDFSGDGAPGSCLGTLDASFCATAGESS